MLLASAFRSEPLTRNIVVGSVIAVAGTAVVTLADGFSGFSLASLVVPAAAFVQGVYHFASKPLLRHYSGPEVATYAMAAGTVFALPLPPATVEAAAPTVRSPQPPTSCTSPHRPSHSNWPCWNARSACPWWKRADAPCV
ncbi:hypothetical protein ACFC09_00620 [Streptomyces sp. NPDC056161]|uniref:hypothetical protein n=1 Tax=Streptomyces sp. NPDC056161 TaxID=3345732 RepID=UPI0035E1642C